MHKGLQTFVSSGSSSSNGSGSSTSSSGGGGGGSYYAALLHIASHSVCPSVPLSLPSVTSRHLANYNDTHVLFRTR